jgi:hypothetical protein
MSATAYGWLQRVRHNTYTVRYRGLVADQANMLRLAFSKSEPGTSVREHIATVP